MNKRFLPTYIASSLYAISTSFYEKEGIRILLIDLDNTMDSYKTRLPEKRSIAWAKQMRESGLSLYIASNNTTERVRTYAQAMDLPALSGLGKPFSHKLRKLLFKKGFNPKECVLIGDQILTDVPAANGAGIRSILTMPLCEDDPPWTRLNRLLERGKRKEIERLAKEGSIKEAL